MIEHRHERGESVDEEDTTLLPEASGAEPAESSIAVEDYGITAAEEGRDEPLAQRLRREFPDLPANGSDREAATGLGGQLVNDGGAVQLTGGGVDAMTAEEAAVHLVAEPRGRKTAPRRTPTDRIELLEAQVAVLLAVARIQTDAFRTLANALERLPTEEPGEGAAKVSRAAHDAHLQLLALRGLPD